MRIHALIARVTEQGYLTPAQEHRLEAIVGSGNPVSAEEYGALQQLSRAVKQGTVLAPARKHCLNVMEELVWEVVLETFASLREEQELPDLGDVAAFALNRLPPLYATTEEGAEYQRQRAREELGETLRAQIAEAVQRGLREPHYYPERIPLAPRSGSHTVAQLLATSADPDADG